MGKLTPTANKRMSRVLLIRILRTAVLILTVILVMFDARHHFDAELVKQKINHHSAQRNWSVFFSQEHVFNASAFRYENDFAEIAKRVTPDKSLLSDLATSYYASAYLPVYVVNIHNHQGRAVRREWHQLLHKRTACYLDVPENAKEFVDFLGQQQNSTKTRPHLALSYVLLNKDSVNRNLRTDCFSLREGHLIDPLSRLTNLVYEGEFLNLYEVY